MNVAARLEQAAQPDDILIGSDDASARRRAVDWCELIERLELKGKAEPVRGLPADLVRVTTGELSQPGSRRRWSAESGELKRLRDAFDNVASDAVVPAVHGARLGRRRKVPSGLGVSAHASMTSPLFTGRCLSYGEGITYWPVVEIVKQAGRAGAAIRRDRTPCARSARREPTDVGGNARGNRMGVSQAARGQEAQEEPLVMPVRRHPVGRGDAFSSLSSMSRISRAGHRYCSCAWPAGAAREATELGWRQAGTRPACCWSRSPQQETDELLVEAPGKAPAGRAAAGTDPPWPPTEIRSFVEEMLALVRNRPTARWRSRPTIQALLGRAPRPARPSRTAACSSAARSRARSSTAAP